MTHKIGLIVGSLRRQSFNRRLASALMLLAPESLEFEPIEIGDLPLYNQDDDEHPHDNVRRLKQQVKEADAILFVTPEYNRSYPGVLKNALDHGSRPYGQSVWEGKPAGVLGISVGSTGTAMAQQHLRNVLSYLDMPSLGQPEVYLQVKEGLFGSGGDIADDGVRKVLQRWIERYAQFVEHHHSPISHAAASAPARKDGRSGVHS